MSFCYVPDKEERWLAIPNNGDCQKPHYIPQRDEQGRYLVSYFHIDAPMTSGEAGAKWKKAQELHDDETASIWRERTWEMHKREQSLNKLLKCIADEVIGEIIGGVLEADEGGLLPRTAKAFASNAASSAITSPDHEVDLLGSVVPTVIDIACTDTVFCFVLQVSICMFTH